MHDALPFSRFVLPYMASNMYLRIEAEEALVVDPQPAAAALAVLQRAAVKRVLVLLTHEHFDHTCGVNFLRLHLPSVCVMAHEKTARCVQVARNNRPLSLLKMVTQENRAEILAAYNSYLVEPIAVDWNLVDGQIVKWRDHTISVSAVPGHSPGSVLFAFDDSAIFTGDYLILHTEVILRYPGGSETEYHEVTLPKLKAIPDGMLLLPGHGEPYCLVRHM